MHKINVCGCRIQHHESVQSNVYQQPVRGPAPVRSKFLPVRKTFTTKGLFFLKNNVKKVIQRIKKIVSERNNNNHTNYLQFLQFLLLYAYIFVIKFMYLYLNIM
jgi:hypothetical protein